MYKIMIATLSLLVSMSATAELKDYTKGHEGPYAGIAVGATYVEVDGLDINDTVLSAGIFGGYRINSYIAAEISAAGYKYKDWDVKGISIGLSVLPIIPINDSLDGFMSLTYGIAAPSDYDGNIVDGFGLGVGFMWHTDELFVRTEIGTGIEDGFSSVGIGLGVGFKF